MQKAAALAYNINKDRAPKVLASGQGTVAQRIIEKAKQFDIPLFANEELVNMLLEVELDECIPVELYEAVVEVFVWLNSLEKNAQMSRTL